MLTHDTKDSVEEVLGWLSHDSGEVVTKEVKATVTKVLLDAMDSIGILMHSVREVATGQPVLSTTTIRTVLEKIVRCHNDNGRYLDALLDSLTAHGRRRLTLDIPPDLPDVLAPSQLLELFLRIFIVNGLQAAPASSGHVNVSVEDLPEDVKITDNGPGLDTATRTFLESGEASPQFKHAEGQRIKISLGLSLAARIAKIVNWRYNPVKRDHGTAIEIFIPKNLKDR